MMAKIIAAVAAQAIEQHTTIYTVTHSPEEIVKSAFPPEIHLKL